jgi:hypothetical protein
MDLPFLPALVVVVVVVGGGGGGGGGGGTKGCSSGGGDEGHGLTVAAVSILTTGDWSIWVRK